MGNLPITTIPLLYGGNFYNCFIKFYLFFPISVKKGIRKASDKRQILMPDLFSLLVHPVVDGGVDGVGLFVVLLVRVLVEERAAVAGELVVVRVVLEKALDNIDE